jgi:dethiobiotin synthetase
MKNNKIFFITGTDTEVGKTFVSCGILEAANRKGLSTVAIKPIAAGARKTAEGLRNDDALVLLDRMSLSIDYDEINPVCFEQAIAPHIAANHEARELSVSEVSQYCRTVIARQADLTIIEGVGGWKVPINNGELLSLVVKELNVPVILVVAMRLGCINHALLSAEAIIRDGVKLEGWIANQLQASMPCFEDNLETLKHLLPAPCLGVIAYHNNFNASSSCADELELDKLLKV